MPIFTLGCFFCPFHISFLICIPPIFFAFSPVYSLGILKLVVASVIVRYWLDWNFALIESHSRDGNVRMPKVRCYCVRSILYGPCEILYDSAIDTSHARINWTMPHKRLYVMVRLTGTRYIRRHNLYTTLSALPIGCTIEKWNWLNFPFITISMPPRNEHNCACEWVEGVLIILTMAQIKGNDLKMRQTFEFMRNHLKSHQKFTIVFSASSLVALFNWQFCKHTGDKFNQNLIEFDITFVSL